MSDRYERIVSILDDQWRTTRELAEMAGVVGYERVSAVYHTLSMAEKYRQAEKRIVLGGKSGRIAEWRRRQ